MELEGENQTVAACEKNQERLAQRNGYRDRIWETAPTALEPSALRQPVAEKFIPLAEETGLIIPIGRWVAVELRIPKLRKGSHLPRYRSFLP